MERQRLNPLDVPVEYLSVLLRVDHYRGPSGQYFLGMFCQTDDLCVQAGAAIEVVEDSTECSRQV